VRLKQKTLQPAPPNDAAQPTVPIESGNYRAVFGVCVFLLCAVWVVFGQTLGHGFINYDDEEYVYGNPHVIHGLNLKGIEWAFTHRMCDFYHPLTMASFMLDAQAYGLKAGGYHLTNILLHGMTAILLFLVLRRMMDPGANKSVGVVATPAGALWPSAFVAAVFAIHPLRVESVAWVTERKDVLSGLFFVLTLGAYVRYTRNSFSPVRYLTVIVLFALGLLSKPSLVTLPFLLLLLDYWPLARMQPAVPRSTFKVLRPLIIEKIPLFLLSTASCVVTILTQQSSLAQVGKFPLFSRAGYAAVSYVVYLGQMFYPAGLAVLYPYPKEGLPLPEVVLALALLAGISVGVLALRRRRPYLVVGWLWYLGMLVPMIGVVQAGSVARADRFTYLAQIGVSILLTWTVVELTAPWRSRRWVLGGGAMVVLAVLITCARIQTTYWRNSETLWTHTLACTSDNYVAQNGLGSALLKMGNVDEAIADSQKALQINPDFAEAHNNLGNALFKKGDVDEAIAHYQKALQIKPDYVEAHNNLGNALFKKGNVDEAIAHYQKALQIKPDYEQVNNNLGVVLAKAHSDYANTLVQMGRDDEAMVEFREALELFPDFADARHGLALILLQKGQVDEAIVQFQKIREQYPDKVMASFDLGNAYFQKGQLDEAAAFYQRALKIKPDDVSALNNLGMVLLTKGMADEAVVQFRKALALQPDFALARTNLNKALLQKGASLEK
jgi:Flp pilus assembly protein TadD